MLNERMVLMRIVIFDGKTTNPGDLSFDGFKKLGEVDYYNNTPKDKIIERGKDADVLIVNKTPLTKEYLDLLPKCKYIGLLATGFDNVDVNYAKKLGIAVANVPNYSSKAVAQMTFAHILNISNHVLEFSDSVKEKGWPEIKYAHFNLFPSFELSGKTLGLLGFGSIAREVAKIALSFDMKVIANNTSGFSFSGVTAAKKHEIFQQSDILSLHLPLNENTKEIVCKQTIDLMKKSAIIVNTARGGLVNESDLADALNNNKIKAACVDVLTKEPPESNNPLLNAKNFFITPHVAWSAFETRKRLINIAISNLEAFLNSKPINIVN